MKRKQRFTLMLLACIMVVTTLIQSSVVLAKDVRTSVIIDGFEYILNAEDDTAVLSRSLVTTIAIIPATIMDNGTVYTVNEIGQSAFYFRASLRTLSLPNTLKKINNNAFIGCKSLEDFTLPEGLVEIDDYAFYGCESITTVTLPSTIRFYGKESFSECSSLKTFNFPSDMSNIPLSYQSFWNDDTVTTNYDVYANFKKWFEGSTVLPKIDDSTLPTPDLIGWDSIQQGTNTDDSQLFKSARYTNEEKTEAEIRFDLSYSAKLANANDVIFVLDDTTSMYIQSSSKGSRLFTMLSKVADTSEAFLTTPNYDNRVAFVSFSMNVNASLDFTEDWSKVDSFIYNEMGKGGETNYSIGFEAAKQLIDNRNDTSRNPIVIFLSDGEAMPSLPGLPGMPEMPDFSGVKEAKAIMDANIPIYGIAMDMDAPDSIRNVSTKAFSSNSPEELNIALNEIISDLLTEYLLVDVISSDFELNGNELTAISASGGAVVFEDGKLSWDLAGTKPATNYTLTIKIKQKSENGVFPSGNIKTNTGEAILSNDTEKINGVNSPVIDRGDAVKVIYDPGKETQGNVPKDNVDYGVASTVILKSANSLERDGYLFAGWSTTEDGNKVEYKVGDSFIIMRNTTLYPVWEIDTNQSFNVNYEFLSTKNPSGVNVPQSAIVEYGKTIGEPSLVAPNGWKFDGWYSNKEGTQKYDFHTPVKGDMTLYGKWISKHSTTADSEVSAPKTGDKTNLNLIVTLFVASFGCILLLKGKVKRQRD